MTNQTTDNLSNSIRTQYVADYMEASYGMRLYDQLAVPVPSIPMEEAIRGSAVQVPYLSGMAPGVTAISQSADVTPQALLDAVASLTPTSRGEALQWAEAVDIRAYTNYGQERFKKLGENMMESIELLASAAATQGAWVEYPRGSGGHTSRATLDAGTAGDRASDAVFRKFQAMMLQFKIPGFINERGEANTWSATMHPFIFHDICESGNVSDVGLYQNEGIHLNFELGKLGPFRLVVSPYAKVFGGAGADATGVVATTLAASGSRLGSTITTAADVSGSATYGLWWTIGTEETGDTHYATNERVRILSADGTELTILGEGENGRLRFDHAIGEAVRNADSVYTIVFGGPKSLVKVHVPGWEFGTVVGPKKDGLLDQFGSIGWKFYGNYGLLTPNRVLRLECATSYEA